MSYDVNIITAIIGFAGGILGVIVGAIIQRRYNLSEGKKDATIALYHEFNSSDMTISRMVAYDILHKNMLLPEPLSLSELDEDLSTEQWVHIERVRCFYERMLHLHEADCLDEDLVRKFFARLAVAWFRLFDEVEELARRQAQIDGRNAPNYEFTSADVQRLFLNERP